MRVNPSSAGNIDHIQQWVDHLLTTTSPQVNSRLAKLVYLPDGAVEVGFCCLGKGCEVAGIARKKRYGEGRTVFTYEECADLPPATFHEWLGLPYGGDETDIDIDWPSTYDNPHEGGTLDFTCAGLNDDVGLTFPQIADVIAYFGLKA